MRAPSFLARNRRFGFALLCGLSILACSDDPEPASSSGTRTASRQDAGDTVLRERAIGTFIVDRSAPEAALAVLEPLLGRDKVEPDDLLLAASLALQGSDFDRSALLVDRATTAGSTRPAAEYLRARLAHFDGLLELEIDHLQNALAGAPDDPATKLCLATALLQSDGGEAAFERAEGILLEVLELGSDNGSPWYTGAVYQLLRAATLRDDQEQRRAYGDLFQSLERRGFNAPKAGALNEGLLARIVPARPTGTATPAPAKITFQSGPPVVPSLAGSTALALEDLDGDHRPDIVASGPNGLLVTTWRADELEPHTLLEGEVRLARAFDLHNDGDSLDILYAIGPTLGILEQNAPGTFTPTPLALPTLPAEPADQVLVDFDHDGDLDILVVGPFGARLLRNDGAARLLDTSGNEYPRGAFTDVTQEAGLAQEAAFAWCTTEDFDADQDVDLLLGGPDALLLASNLRGGRFEDVTGAVFGAARLQGAPLCADLDGDARVDLFEPGSPSRLWMQDEAGRMAPRTSSLVVPTGARPEARDLDLDGALDVVWPGTDNAFEGALALGFPQERSFGLGDKSGGPLALADLDFAADRSCDVEVVQLVEGGVRIWRAASPVGHATRFKFSGRKDNRQAVGLLVEVRAGGIYRRIYGRGRALEVGYGTLDKIDVVRLTWPNGVVQSLLDVEPGDRFSPATTAHDFGFDTSGVTTESVVQDEGLVGSCPFLYTWNGKTFTFVTDVLGITPLGLPMAPGRLVPPDHDEYVLIRGDQLVPRDGRLELQVTEELREVTYLDHARLQAIDHPLGTGIFPNERFCFPPFPEAHVHSVRAPLVPMSATDAEGRDWSDALSAIDDVCAVHFERLPPQYQGLAAPHYLELRFDPAAVRRATGLRLVCTGWLQWSNASVNVAAARTPGVAFVPPTLQVPGPEGTWIDAGPPVGFPAGKTKTMVIDVGSILSADDPRLRIASTLQLYWDRIVLATDADDAPLAATSLPAIEAKLWWRGFSAPLPATVPPRTEAEEGALAFPEQFDWDVTDTQPRWNQHPGMYTRYGDCLPLLDTVDDRFVLLGSGDTLTLVFDAAGLPEPAAGTQRSWLLYLDGWAKDRDPNTVEALNVEPLPFHGMSAYPYDKDEAFPDDELHRAWRREWNTRPAYQPLVPLAPDREQAWADGIERTP
jgi:hypothetical protein